jgi:hypothetical protein
MATCRDPPELIEAFYEKWQEGYEVVYGIRVKRDATLFLKVAYKAFYRVFRATSYVPMPLDAGDFSLLDRKVIDALAAMPENNRFIRGMRTWVGFKQTGVSVCAAERMFGRTRIHFCGILVWARKAVFSFSYMPLDIITALALLTVGFSIVGIIAQVHRRTGRSSECSLRLHDPDCSSFSSAASSFLCLSIIGSYRAHIYDEVKRRPAFIVQSILKRSETSRERVAPPQNGERMKAAGPRPRADAARMKRVAITGAAGFVGANLTRRLLDDGHEVHLLIRPGPCDVADRPGSVTTSGCTPRILETASASKT